MKGESYAGCTEKVETGTGSTNEKACKDMIRGKSYDGVSQLDGRNGLKQN